MKNQVDLFAGSGSLGVVTPNDRVVAFGKFKGQPFEVLLKEPQYALWLMSSMTEKLRLHHPALLAFLISRYGLPDRTPAHNKLQNRFLDHQFALRFAIAANSRVRTFCEKLAPIDVGMIWRGYVERAFSAVLAEPELSDFDRRAKWPSEGDRLDRLRRMRDALKAQGNHIAAVVTPFDLGCQPTEYGVSGVCQIAAMQFEEDGADVVFRCIGEIGVETSVVNEYDLSAEHKQGTRPLPVLASRLLHHSVNEGLQIEVKPVVGDDYPAILRAMKAVKGRQLLVGEYNGEGATWDEVVKVFGMSGIRAVLLSEVEGIALPPEALLLPITPISTVDALAAVESGFAEAVERLPQAKPSSQG